MQEYFNLDIQENFSLNAPQEINHKNKQAALLASKYIENNDSITSSLRCVKPFNFNSPL